MELDYSYIDDLDTDWVQEHLNPDRQDSRVMEENNADTRHESRVHSAGTRGKTSIFRECMHWIIVACCVSAVIYLFCS